MNLVRRSLAVPGQASAVFATGTHKVESGHGNGDALLLDFDALFFAVADGSDRFPTAGRRLLRRMADALSADPAPRDPGAWLALVNRSFSKQKTIHTTTFAGIALMDTPGNPRAVVITGGDSLVLVVDTIEKTVIHSSPVDMNFAGRVSCLGRAEEVDVSRPGLRIILSSDGMADLARLSGQDLGQMTVAAAARFPVAEVPEKLARFMARQDADITHDDLGVIVLDPAALVRQPFWALLGGTPGSLEKKFHRDRDAGIIPDQWVPLENFTDFSYDPLDTGVRIERRESTP